MNGARPPGSEKAGAPNGGARRSATGREGVGRGAGGTPRKGPEPRKRGVPGYLGGAKDRPAGLLLSRIIPENSRHLRFVKLRSSSQPAEGLQCGIGVANAAHFLVVLDELEKLQDHFVHRP